MTGRWRVEIRKVKGMSLALYKGGGGRRAMEKRTQRRARQKLKKAGKESGEVGGW